MGMEATTMKWLIFITFAFWFYFALALLTRRQRHLATRVGEVVSASVPDRSGAAKREIRKLTVRGALRKLALTWFRKRPLIGVEKVQLKLAQAGQPMNYTVAEWFGVRMLGTVAGLLVGLLGLTVTKATINGVFLLAAGILMGWMGPEFWLSRRVQTRQGLVRKQLPSTLDLLTVSVEAGLGFDQAMSRVSQKLKGPLAREFERALREIQLGSQRSSALQGLASRTGVEDVQAFVSAVIQADKLGIGLAQVLRVQSAEVRRRRRMDAEERAMKAPVKMLFPLVLFVFPALFIIILGPAVLHMVQVFGHS